MAGPMFAAYSAWVTKKRRSGGEPFATESDLTGPGIEAKISRADSVTSRPTYWL